MPDNKRLDAPLGEPTSQESRGTTASPRAGWTVGHDEDREPEAGRYDRDEYEFEDRGARGDGGVGVAERRMTERAPHAQSIGALLRSLTSDTTTLVRDEVALARAEMMEKLNVFQKNLASIGVGAAVLLVGLVFLVEAARRALALLLEEFVDPEVAVWLAPLIVGAILGLVGWVMINKGKKTIQHESVVPKKTAQTLKEDTRWVREKVS